MYAELTSDYISWLKVPVRRIPVPRLAMCAPAPRNVIDREANTKKRRERRSAWEKRRDERRSQIAVDQTENNTKIREKSGTQRSRSADDVRENQRMSKRNLCLEFLWLDHNNKYK